MEFYQTWWFVLLVAALVAVAAGLLARQRFRRLEARNRELEAEIARQEPRIQEARRELEAILAEKTKELDEVKLELERRASEDTLTNIPTLQHFLAHLDDEWRRGIRTGKPVSVLLIDMDRFKKFNDKYGMPAGDECLKRVAGVLRERVKRGGDMAARYGGSEFVVLLADADAAGATAVAWDLRRGVEELGIPHEDSDAAQVVTVSVGCATIVPREGSDASDLIAVADHALNRSKSEGRNRISSVDLTAPSARETTN